MPYQMKPTLPRSVSRSALVVRERLQEALDKDLKKPNEYDALVHYLETFAVFTSRLPSVRRRSCEYMRYFMNQVLDNNVDFELCDAKIINWWTPFLKKLFPFTTTGDGNCLLHAVSLAMWGCNDNSHFLRRLTYIVVSVDAPDEFRKRWLREQKYQDECESRLEIVLTSMQWQTQWEDILKQAEDRVQTTNVNATALESLEGIHIFVLANILRRPIIVLSETVQHDFQGQAIGYNHLGGIYLPLLWKPTDCVRTPIVLAYHSSHFVPMLSMMDPPDVDMSTETGKHGVPLVSSDLQQLPLHYLKEGEERESGNLLTLYLDVFETDMIVRGTHVPVLYAKFRFQDIDPEFNMIDGHMEMLDYTFQVQQGAEKTNLFPTLNNLDEPGQPLEPTAPTESLLSNMSEMSIHTVPRPDPPVVPPSMATSQAPGQMNASTENIFFPSQRSAASYPPRQTQTPVTQVNASASYPPPRRSPEYRDVSISGEECITPSCSFYSSMETYPYCHECKAKLKKMRSSQHLPGVREDEESGHSLSASRLSSTGPNDEVFGDPQFRMPSILERQRSLSYEEELEHDLQHRRDEQPHSIPYTANRVGCLYPDCPKRGKGICEGKCHEHYRDIGSRDLHMLRTGENRPRSRSHYDQMIPRTEREGERGVRANRVTASASETRRTGSESPRTGRSGAPEPGTRSLENTNTPASAATYPPMSPVRIGQSRGRVPGNILEPTSMRLPETCRTPGCTNLGYERSEGFCQTCFNAISLATAGMARNPKQSDMGFPPTPRLPCRTPNCMIYAKPDMEGYCELCFHRLFDEQPGSVLSSVSESTRPNPPQSPTNLQQPRAEKCPVPTCDRYGDPAYRGMCKQCLDLQTQTRRTGLELKRNPERQNPTRNPTAGPTTTCSEVHTVYETAQKEIIERASKKATGRCKNSRCQNYGNASCHGYCNSCYQSMQ
ncbi:tumor necrosis factor alpha-induced protein 3-like [Lineus longissimus]|uniref:tumor necrosis factor alpha-induced protein 3-like n=1 Tax=Lineus longissimus TaxID=88925 RepID=UPI002B4F36E5